MQQLKLIQPDWPAPAHVRAYCTTRLGGYSQAPYNSFNLAQHVGDDAKAVQANRQLLQTQLQLPNTPLWLTQTHSDIAICADEIHSDPHADAAYTRQANIVCAVLTADCLPILLCNTHGTEIAAIHAGWRGLLKGIIENTIAAMHSQPQELFAWFGPAMGPQAFQVKQDVRQPFINKNLATASAFQAQGAEHWLADIYALAKIQLQQCQVNHIYGGNLCTYHDADLFYSYRRDDETGRMASLIWLKNE